MAVNMIYLCLNYEVLRSTAKYCNGFVVCGKNGNHCGIVHFLKDMDMTTIQYEYFCFDDDQHDLLCNTQLC